MPRLPGLLLASVLLAVGCDPVEVRIGRARLADADAVVQAADGLTVEVLGPGTQVPAGGGVVRLAIDRDASFGAVVEAVRAVRAAGGKPVLLVATRRNKVMALPEADADEGEGFWLEATGNAGPCKGEGICACVAPPDAEVRPDGTIYAEKGCAARKDHKSLDRSFVRQLVREGRELYRVSHVRVVVEPTATWADAVRTIDGARTCCEGETVRVSVRDLGGR